MDPLNEKTKLVYSWEQDPEEIFSFDAFKMFAVFKIYDVKDRPVLAPKITFYVTYDLNLSCTDKCSDD